MLDFIPKHGDMFVDLSQPYEKIKFIKAEQHENNNEENLLGFYVADPVAGKPLDFERKSVRDFKGPLFPLFSSVWKPRAELSDFYHIYQRIKKLVDKLLAAQYDFSANVSDLLGEIKSSGHSHEHAEAVIKSLLANQFEYRFSGKGFGGRIYFGEHTARFYRWSIYYKSIADELKIKSKQISLLVSHGPTVGNFREIILRDLIRKFLPQKFRIATGFIQGFPNQIDILIFDAHNYAPLFQEGELVVLKQEAVRAIIEVKTTLTRKTLNESLELFNKLSLPGYKSTKLPIFKAIYSFETTISNTAAIAKGVYDYYNKPYFNPQLQRETIRTIPYLFHQISCVATLNKHCVFAKYQPANLDGTGNLIPHLYSVTDENGLDTQTAMFLSLLFEYLDVETYAKKSSTWNLIERLNDSGLLKMETKLTTDNWQPAFASEGEHSQEQHSIRHRVGTFEKWFSGQISTDALIRDQTELRMHEDKNK